MAGKKRQNLNTSRKIITASLTALIIVPGILFPLYKFIYLPYFKTQKAIMLPNETIFSDTKYLIIKKKNIESTIETPGTITYLEKAAITTLAYGRLEKFYKDQGDKVKKGTMLAKIERKRLYLEYLQVKSLYNSALANLKLQEARYYLAKKNVEKKILSLAREKGEVLASKANYENALLAQKNKEELFKIEGVSQTEYNAFMAEFLNIKSRYYSAIKQYQVNSVGFRIKDIKDFGNASPESRDDWQKAVIQINTNIENNELKVSKANLKKAQAQLKISRILLRETVIRSPIDGIIALRNIETGEMVKADTPLYTVVNLDSVYIISSISEEKIFQIKKGQKARFSVDALPGDTFAGTVHVVAPILDPKTRTAEVKIKSKNKDAKFKPGMFVRARIIVAARKNTIEIPEGSFVITNKIKDKKKNANIQQGAKNAYCFIIKDAIAYRKNIIIGKKFDTGYEIIRGLNEKDIIALSNIEALSDGTRIYTQKKWQSIIRKLNPQKRKK